MCSLFRGAKVKSIHEREREAQEKVRSGSGDDVVRLDGRSSSFFVEQPAVVSFS